MLKIKRKNLYLHVILLFCGMLFMLIKNPTFCLLIAIVQMCLIIMKAKFSIFSIFTFLIDFCLLQEYGAYVGWNVYGLLSYTYVPIYFYEMFLCTFLFNEFVLWFMDLSNCIKNERMLFDVQVNVGFKLSVLLCIFAVIITVLIFPSLPSLSSFTTENRFNSGYLSFQGWSCMPYFFLAIAIMNKRCSKCALISIFFVMSWYVFHGERVDCIGFLSLLAIKYYNENRNKKTVIMRIVLIIGGVVALFVAVGMLRAGMKNIKVTDVVNGILIQSTACDVTYVFNCAMDLAKKGECLHGITYLSYIVNCVPLLNDPYSFESYIHDYYYTAGGGHFFAEPVANFGIPFTIVFSFFYILFLTRVVRKATRYRYMVYAALCISIFRSAWYGLNYPIVTILYFTPVILFASEFMKKIVKKEKHDVGLN